MADPVLAILDLDDISRGRIDPDFAVEGFRFGRARFGLGIDDDDRLFFEFVQADDRLIVFGLVVFSEDPGRAEHGVFDCEIAGDLGFRA